MRVPKMLPHSSGNYRVIINKKAHYLGKDKQDAEKKYRQLIADHLGAHPGATSNEAGGTHLATTVSELVDQFKAHQQEICSPRWWDRKVVQIEQAVEPAVRLYGDMNVNAFGARAFHVVRGEYAKAKNKRSRRYVNELSRKLRQAFKWGAEREIVAVDVYQRLAIIPLLKPRELGLSDNPEVEDVAWSVVEATLGFMSDRNADLIRLLWETAMRPDEMLRMRVGESNDGLYRPKNHKTDRFNKRRVIGLSKAALDIVKRYEDGVPPGGLLFDWHADSHSLYHAVQRACKAGKIKPWFPYQLRHAAMTRIALEHGQEVAQAQGGHSTRLMTAHYDHGNEVRVRRMIG